MVDGDLSAAATSGASSGIDQTLVDQFSACVCEMRRIDPLRRWADAAKVCGFGDPCLELGDRRCVLACEQIKDLGFA